MIRFACAALLLVIASPLLSGPPRPNLVVILADDMGFSDIGCYGGEIRTPNLDRLAAGGLRFTQFYNTGRCCPTRAALLTGRYQHQAGIGHMTGDKGVEGYRGFLNDRCATIAEMLKPAGYTTLMCGKWHVGSAAGQWPLSRGFSRFYGVPQGGGFYFKVRQGRSVVLDDRETTPPPGWYCTDAFNDHAAKFVTEAAKLGKPFFLYLAHIAPHWPLQARDEDVARYRGSYRKGWDEVRKARYARLVQSGIIDASWKISPRDPKSVPWSEEGKVDDLDLRMSVYAAQVEALDRGIGRLLAAIEKAGQAENTLVMFLSDNGGSAEGGLRGFSRGKKGAPIGSADSYASYGLGWANASNTPFRRFKARVHEGGVATPFIAYWPKGIGRRGELEHQVGHVMDILPTCVSLAGADPSKGANASTRTPVEGRSLVDVFAGKKLPERTLFWEHQGDRAVRRGKWKLVAPHKGAWELYDLQKDRTELHDLAASQAERVRELTAEWEAWAKRAGVRPWPVKKR